MISTDLAVAVPEGTYGRVAPRSGLGELISRVLELELMPTCSLEILNRYRSGCR